VARTCPDGHTTVSEDYCDVCGLALTDSGSDGGVGAADGAGGGPDPDATAPDLSPVGGTTQECPHCSATNPADALFCEACGYDYTTGTMPRPIEPPTFPGPSSLDLPDPDSAAAAPDTGGDDAAGDADPGAAADGPGEPDASESEDAADAGETADADPGAAPSMAAFSTSPAPLLDTPWVAEIWIDPDWYADQGSADRLPSPGLPTVVVIRHTSNLIGRLSRSRGIVPELDISGDPGVSRRHAQLTTDGSRWFVEDLGSANGTFVGTATAGLPTDPLGSGERREIRPDEQLYLGAWTRIVIRKAADGEA